jgi:hypothetical protein
VWPAPVWIRTADEAEALARDLRGVSAVAIDTEADSLHHYPERLCLIQLADPAGRVFFLDALVLVDLEPLRPLFGNPATLKVFHSGDNDVVYLKRRFGLAFAGAIMLATLSFSFTHLAEQSTVLAPAQQQQIADVLEHDAEVISNTQLQQQLTGEPKAVQDEIISINTDARHRALQVALLVPLLAGLIGLLISFRMMRLPDPKPSDAAEGMSFG